MKTIDGGLYTVLNGMGPDLSSPGSISAGQLLLFHFLDGKLRVRGIR
jgi:hypothetical protein